MCTCVCVCVGMGLAVKHIKHGIRGSHDMWCTGTKLVLTMMHPVVGGCVQDPLQWTKAINHLYKWRVN